ncbi:MAG: PD-(D/E)XK nuclease family protein [Porticoccaceae bacterium]|nr:PD-(D/E)XK nuclease family protein [Porticoccaceae bacterium]
MLPPLIDIALFRDAIESNHLILTANQRLAAQVQQAWGQSLAAATAVWSVPRVMSMEHWLSHCWHELQDQNHPLAQGLAEVGRLQSIYYWERAIVKHENQLNNNFASMANNCLDLLQRWNLSVDDLQDNSAAVSKFKRWAGTYQGLLNKNGLVTTATSWSLVKAGFAQAALPKEPLIALYGFQSLSPLQTSVLESAGAQNVEIEACDRNMDALKLQCADPAEELQTAARWAAAELAKQPQQRIGLLLPDLNKTVQRTARVISEALAVENCPAAVNISAGTTFADVPLMQSALGLLELFNYQRPLQDWLGVLYSPCSIFEQLPVQFRVDCELALRATRSHQINFDKFVQILRGRQGKLEVPDQLQPVLQPLYEAQQSLRQISSTNKTFSDWAAFFDQFIGQLGWPGSKQLDSLQYQQRQQWSKLLSHYAELDNLGIEVGRSTALVYLQRLASEQLFHPQTGDAPLQVLGLLEGVGLQFDQLWVLGMHSGNFPSSGAMDAILPAEYQRAQEMPHSLPERELQIACSLLNSYRDNAKKLILSFPVSDGQTPIEPSPLIKDIQLAESQGSIAPNSTMPPWLLQAQQCLLVADRGQPFDATREPIRGGSSLLKNESTCPFNAFAIHRLWAKPLEQPLMGLSPLDRGSIVHEILYRLWGLWGSSEAMMRLSEQQLSEQVEEHIEAVLSEQAGRHPCLLGERFNQLEQQRLTKLILQWLEIEKERPAFTVIATEQATGFSFEGLQVSLIIDRLDNVHGNCIVIDYKTGNVSASDWLGERPKDPQLPLYVLASASELSGCAFAQLRDNKLKFIGVSDNQLITDVTVIEDWQLQTEQWRQALRRLASEFVEGRAQLEVYNKKEFAYQAHLLPLNRWHEQADIQPLLNAVEAEL